MKLSPELIAQFVKATNDSQKQETKSDTLTYGTLYKNTSGTTAYTLKLDGYGSDATPIPVGISNIATGVTIPKDKTSTRVVVLIKNHAVTIISSLEDSGAKVTTLDGVIVDLAAVEEIKAQNVTITGTLEAQQATINELEAKKATVANLNAAVARISTLETNTLTAAQIAARYASIDMLESDYAKLDNLNALDAYIYELEATYGTFKDTTTEKLAATDAFIQNASVTFANIDFTNIGKAAIENLFATSGLIENVTVGDGTITGMLVGVTIKGDLIEGGTIIADKLVIQGEDGLYYKLNTDGVTTEAEQTEYNSLNGSVITAKSITATQISVSDLVAFDATIGGFTISDDSIYSEVKDSDGNTTRGIHLGADGQVNFGDQSNFIKYYKDDDGTYKLAISAASILYSLNGKQHSIADIGKLGEYVHIGTYEGEPCIELGESDSDFKLVITNTRILFMEGSTVPAHINNQSLHITKAVIEEEIQQGEFVWKTRANGNLGLMWKGEA